MERLTKRIGENVYFTQGKYESTLPAECETQDVRNILHRLAAYEDTGLKPETVSKIRDIVLDISGNLDRLRELAQADRDGRCVVLPCKLHDKVFFVENGCVKETEVDSFHNWTSGRWKISVHTDRMFDHWKGYEIDFSGIGKTVFLTREEAEAKLKERENNG